MIIFLKYFTTFLLIFSFNLNANLDEEKKDSKVDVQGVNDDEAKKARELSDQNAKEPREEKRNQKDRNCKTLNGKLVCETKVKQKIPNGADEIEGPRN